MKKTMITILLALPFVLIFIISLSSKIITTYSEIEVEKIAFVDNENNEIESLIFEPDDGEKHQLMYSLSPSMTTQKDVKFTGYDPSIINIDEEGYITILKEGSTIVRIESRYKTDVFDTVLIEIKDSLPLDLQVFNPNIELKVGSEEQISYSVYPSTAINKNVVFVVADPSICSVNSMGIVKGLSTGETTITIQTVEGKFGPISSIVEIKVIEKTDSIFIDYTSGELFDIESNNGLISIDLFDYLSNSIDKSLVTFEITKGSRYVTFDGHILSSNSMDSLNKTITIKASYGTNTEFAVFRII